MKFLKKLFKACSIMAILICTTHYSIGQTGWLLKGNAGINASKNFIGTIDLQPLKFRINNIPAGELNPVNGNTAFGINTLLLNTTGTGNVAIGTNALYHNTTGRNLVAVGDSALFNFKTLLPTASNNTAIGSKTLFSATGARQSTAIGFQALYSSVSGYDNTANGFQSLFSTTTSANSNTAIGSKSLYANTTGSRNTAIGAFADVSNSALVNATAIGYGTIVSASNSLVLGNGANVGIGTSSPAYKLSVQSATIESNNNTNLLSLTGRNPIIAFNDENNIGYGYIKSITNAPNPGYTTGMEFGASPGYSIFFSTNYAPIMVIGNNGNVGIGTSNASDYKLSVNGTIRSKEVRVETGWSDYVFDKDYILRSLDKVAEYIEQNKHLQGIPSAKEIQENGLAVGEVQTKMMEKIEELTLYLIQQNQLIQKLQEKIEQIQNKNK